eukprot:gene69425-biopygen31969
MNPSYRQCQQPAQHSGLCLNPTGFAAATSTPTTSPSAGPTLDPVSSTLAPVQDTTTQPSSSARSYEGLICQFGSYCRTSADCVAGNLCAISSVYYSQCVANSSSYQTGNCVTNFGSQCSDSSQCCDPGAYCNTMNPSYRQCQQPAQHSGLCLNPTGFAAATSTPTTSPSA